MPRRCRQTVLLKNVGGLGIRLDAKAILNCHMALMEVSYIRPDHHFAILWIKLCIILSLQLPYNFCHRHNQPCQLKEVNWWKSTSISPTRCLAQAHVRLHWSPSETEALAVWSCLGPEQLVAIVVWARVQDCPRSRTVRLLDFKVWSCNSSKNF